ncbi:MAG: tetratricopeptide repeat protein [Bryobacterales bacterium]|nr:tetratricopeptide repeat protein [Bryobacterales bacterium]
MFRKLGLTLTAALAGCLAFAQDTPGRIDVEHYTIEAEINPNTQTLAARAVVRFRVLEDRLSAASFELHNALKVSKVVDGSGEQIPASRSEQDFSIRLNFRRPLPKDEIVTAIFTYDGRLSGQEESPVYGIKFAAIRPEHSFLMYPARWFPVSGYTTDRYAAEMRIAVPAGNRVIASGLESKDTSEGNTVYSFDFQRESFPGSIAVVPDGPGTPVSAGGVTTTFYFRGDEAEQAQAYGETIGNMIGFFTGRFGLAPYARLTVIQTEPGAPNGYAAPGILFLSPRGIGRQVNERLLANHISRQWFGLLTSPVTRNHLWLTNGAASYGEALWLENTAGPGALEARMRDENVEALTMDEIPQSQASRLEDYSPELNALTGSKGAATLHMLRFILGDEPFFQALQAFTKQYEWKSASTADFRRIAEEISGDSLDYFFIQWVESSGAPEFRLEYTIFRTQKGFRVQGKVAQDLDTFRMPVNLKIETEGNPEETRIEVVGTSSEFIVETFGRPRDVILDPENRLLRYSNDMRLAVAIRRGEQYAEVSEFAEALKEYQRALEVNRNSSLAHYRIGEVFFLQNNYQSAANEFREALNGDLQPAWTEVWSHINLGKIFDITGQRERAVNEYRQAERTKDNTQGALEEAAKYLKEPYQRKARDF